MTSTSTEITTADLLQIADTMCRYSEAMDLIGANPVQPGDLDHALGRRHRAAALLPDRRRRHTAVLPRPHRAARPSRRRRPGRVRGLRPPVLHLLPVHPDLPPGRQHPHHPAGPDTATVCSYINSAHWMADGRLVLAPIHYHDTVTRCPDRLWRITERDIHVWRRWVTEGYAPTPADPGPAGPR